MALEDPIRIDKESSEAWGAYPEIKAFIDRNPEAETHVEGLPEAQLQRINYYIYAAQKHVPTKDNGTKDSPGASEKRAPPAFLQMLEADPITSPQWYPIRAKISELRQSRRLNRDEAQLLLNALMVRGARSSSIPLLQGVLEAVEKGNWSSVISQLQWLCNRDPYRERGDQLLAWCQERAKRRTIGTKVMHQEEPDDPDGVSPAPRTISPRKVSPRMAIGGSIALSVAALWGLFGKDVVRKPFESVSAAAQHIGNRVHRALAVSESQELAEALQMWIDRLQATGAKLKISDSRPTASLLSAWSGDRLMQEQPLDGKMTIKVDASQLPPDQVRECLEIFEQFPFAHQHREDFSLFLIIEENDPQEIVSVSHPAQKRGDKTPLHTDRLVVTADSPHGIERTLRKYQPYFRQLYWTRPATTPLTQSELDALIGDFVLPSASSNFEPPYISLHLQPNALGSKFHSDEAIAAYLKEKAECNVRIYIPTTSTSEETPRIARLQN